MATGDRPVMIDAREGTHCGQVTYARSNRIPSAANRSRFGVLISLFP
jgi:hypothetical protein